MSKKDYYEILGVSKNATQQEIKAAYKKLAKKYHPDVNKNDPQAESMFKELGEAYQVLSDGEKRAAYDRLGHAAFDQAARSGFSGYRAYNINFEDLFGGGFRDPFDIFNEFFGTSPFGFSAAGTRGQASQQGNDLLYELALDFDEAVHGVEKEISYERRGSCTVCKGSGAASGSSKVTCPTCGGQGQVRETSQIFFGAFSTIRTCSQCNGEGVIIEKPCLNCRGRGVTKERKRLKIKVPAGVDTGYHLRFRGEGDAGEQGAPWGDLYVRFEVKPHKFFKREGDDILLDLPISFSQATLGDVTKVPSIDGEVKMRIPAGTQSGTQFRLRGKGVPHFGSYGRGDQFVNVQLQTPQRLNSELKELFEQLRLYEPKPKE